MSAFPRYNTVRMGASYILLASLLSMFVMLILKDWELQKGRKPFSALRYRLDTLLRKKALQLVSYTAYANRQTAKLLLLFIFEHTKKIFHFLYQQTINSKLFSLARGRYQQFMEKDSPHNSDFLNSLASYKEEKDSDTDEPRA